MITMFIRSLVAMVTLGIVAPNFASAFGPCCCFCNEGRCQVDVTKKEVDKTAFDIECEAICIPPLRFPWECGPLKKCGKVRVVKKLVPKKTKATVCNYKWSAIACCPSCASKLRRGCGGCDDGAGSPCDQPCLPCDSLCDGYAAADGSPIAIPASTQPALIAALEHAKADASGWKRVSHSEITPLDASDASGQGDMIEAIGTTLGE